jgi:hypothetical protein
MIPDTESIAETFSDSISSVPITKRADEMSKQLALTKSQLWYKSKHIIWFQRVIAYISNLCALKNYEYTD